MKKDIVIDNCEDFNPTHIFECGQIFRYKKEKNKYIVYTKDKKAEILINNNRYIIRCEENDLEYFKNYFDLSTDYSNIKNNLKLFNIDLLNESLKYGYGIRILKQDILETIISFIISSNNRIPRIQKSIEYICSNAGKNMGDYYAFPTLNKLNKLDVEFFKKAGLGYRAEYMIKAIKQLNEINLEKTNSFDTNKLHSLLISLYGVGPKVADCVLLFAYSRKNIFPVDTWIKKIYEQDLKGNESNRIKIAKNLVNTFGDLSGYAQQYLFYYKRTFNT